MLITQKSEKNSAGPASAAASPNLANKEDDDSMPTPTPITSSFTTRKTCSISNILGCDFTEEPKENCIVIRLLVTDDQGKRDEKEMHLWSEDPSGRP